jgi:hypothetical protein
VMLQAWMSRRIALVKALRPSGFGGVKIFRVGGHSTSQTTISVLQSSSPTRHGDVPTTAGPASSWRGPPTQEPYQLCSPAWLTSEAFLRTVKEPRQRGSAFAPCCRLADHRSTLHESSNPPRHSYLRLGLTVGLAAWLTECAHGQVCCGPIDKAKQRTERQKEMQKKIVADLLTRRVPAEPIGSPPTAAPPLPIGAPPKASPRQYGKSGALPDKSVVPLRPMPKSRSKPVQGMLRATRPSNSSKTIRNLGYTGAGVRKPKPLTALADKAEQTLAAQKGNATGAKKRSLTVNARRKLEEGVESESQQKGTKIARAMLSHVLEKLENPARPGELRLDQRELNRMQGWVTRVMQATLLDKAKLPQLLSEASQMRPSATVTHSTGAVIALRSDWIWEGIGEAQTRKRMALLKVWKLAVTKEIATQRSKFGKATWPPNLRRSELLEKGWKERLFDFERHLKSMQPDEAVMETHCCRLATRLLLAGFKAVEDLAGLPTPSIEKITMVPREQTLLTKVVHEMNWLAAQGRVERIRRSMGLQQPEKSGPRSAIQIAATLTPQQLASLEKSNEELQQQLKVQLDKGPRRAIDSMVKARERGQTKELQEMLANRETELRLSSQRKSLPQVAAGLKAWHIFATGVLQYSAEATLPPESSSDVSKFLLCFSNPGTAANYLSYIRWSCREFKKSLLWSDSSLTSLIGSIKKQDLATRVANLPEGVRFEETAMDRLIILAWELQDPEWGLLACMAYQCLFRVQSEALPLQFGAPEEALHPLPEARHSSVWMEGKRVYVRLRCRKNRPQGSLLIRECNCEEGQARDQRLCPVHCMDWNSQVPGQQVFRLSATAATQKLRRYATMLGLRGAGEATLKVFRSSRATNLALQGRPIHQILEAGEWRSAAMLKYVAPEALDRGSLLTAAVMEEDADED